MQDTESRIYDLEPGLVTVCRGIPPVDLDLDDDTTWFLTRDAGEDDARQVVSGDEHAYLELGVARLEDFQDPNWACVVVTIPQGCVDVRSIAPVETDRRLSDEALRELEDLLRRDSEDD